MERKKTKINTPLDDAYLIISLIFVAGALTVAALKLFTPLSLSELLGECLLLKVIGIYCPVCGGTRAFLALLQGHVIKSILLHPIVIYGAVMGPLFLVFRLLAFFSYGKINLFHARMWWLWVSIGICIFQFLEKNILLLFFHIGINFFT